MPIMSEATTMFLKDTLFCVALYRRCISDTSSCIAKVAFATLASALQTLTVLSPILPLALDTLFKRIYAFDSADQLCRTDFEMHWMYYKYIPSVVLLMIKRFLTWLEKDDISLLKATIANYEERLSNYEATIAKHEERLSAHTNKYDDHEYRITGHESLHSLTMEQLVMNTTQLGHLEEHRIIQCSNVAYDRLLQHAIYGSDDEAA